MRFCTGEQQSVTSIDAVHFESGLYQCLWGSAAKASVHPYINNMRCASMVSWACSSRQCTGNSQDDNKRQAATPQGIQQAEVICVGISAARESNTSSYTMLSLSVLSSLGLMWSTAATIASRQHVLVTLLQLQRWVWTWALEGSGAILLRNNSRWAHSADLVLHCKAHASMMWHQSVPHCQRGLGRRCAVVCVCGLKDCIQCFFGCIPDFLVEDIPFEWIWLSSVMCQFPVILPSASAKFASLLRKFRQCSQNAPIQAALVATTIQ